MAPLVAAWGLDKTLAYSKQLAAQDPVWTRGQSLAHTKLAAGELALYPFSNHYQVDGPTARAKFTPQDLQLVVLEPVPVRIAESFGILKTSKRTNAGLLFIEFMAGPEGQAILQKSELSPSIYGDNDGLKKYLDGKQLAVADYAMFDQMDSITNKIVESFGFPKAEVQ
jgi:ABC-type Fe3+ transport system substrate-binding protein